MINSPVRENLIIAGIKGKGRRSMGTVIIVTVLSFVMLVSIIAILSLGNGINSLSDRMGADLMVVPLGYESGAEDILIKGEPSYFYIERTVLDDIKDIEGIEEMSPQFYLTSSNQGCCDIPVQFIGIDEATDFSVSPWIRDTYKKEGLISGDHIVVGNDIDIPENGKLKFFDEYFNVSAQLEETGTGLDQAVFANMITIKKLFNAAKKKGFNFTDDLDPDNSISSVMIKVKKGYSPEDVKHNIRSKVDGLQIIETKSMTNSIEGSLQGFKIVLYVMLIILTVLSMIILALVFDMNVRERIRIYAVMRSVGASTGQITKLVLREALLLSGIGAVIGIVLASLIIYPFNTYISTIVHIPYLLPKTSVCLAVTFIILITQSVIGPVTAAMSAIKAGRADIYKAGRQV